MPENSSLQGTYLFCVGYSCVLIMQAQSFLMVSGWGKGSHAREVPFSNLVQITDALSQLCPVL